MNETVERRDEMRITEASAEVDTNPSGGRTTVSEPLKIRKATSTRPGSFTFAKNSDKNRVPLH